MYIAERCVEKLAPGAVPLRLPLTATVGSARSNSEAGKLTE
jgi:hypothetical protein